MASMAPQTNISLPSHHSLFQTQSTESPDYANEQIFQRNRLPFRAYHLPADSLLLNGTWDFHYATLPLHSPEPSDSHNGVYTPDSPPAMASDESGLDFEALGQTSPVQWTKINVPGHWQLQGFGKPQYTNVQFPIPVDPPNVPTENPTGTYRRSFHVPRTWQESSQIRIRFEGVDSAFHLWLNGVFVGYHQGSRNSCEFDITNIVRRDGSNEVFVRVYQWSDATYIEDQDQWWLSGIFRDVYVLALPASRIEDFAVRTHLDDEYRDASLEVILQAVLEHDTDVSLVLRNPRTNDSIVQHSAFSIEARRGSVSSVLRIPNPNKWTAETPHLYDLEISLFSRGSREAIQTIRQQVGFRQVEIKNGLLTVNGKRILLQGVNRHDHHPRFGRAVPLAAIEKDLLLMKSHNINALRCSHYPPDPRMLDLCDKLGFWVMDEADLECHGFYDAVARPLDIPEEMDYEERKKLAFPQAAQYTSKNPRWEGAYVDRMQAVVQRDKNHPSVIIWSLGNEAFYGDNHKAMYDYAKSADPTRPVHYEGDVNAISADMFSYMYPSVDRLIKLAETEEIKDGKFDKPIVLCEYAHAMGNGPGNLAGYQEAFRKYPRLQGGYIWEWANHGLWKEDESGTSYYAYGGDFDELVHDGTFVMDGLCFSDHSPTPGLLEYKKVIEPVHAYLDDDHLSVHNLYDFVNLDHLTATYRVESFGDNTHLICSGVLKLPHISPGTQENIQLPCEIMVSRSRPETWLTVSFRTKNASPWTSEGHEVAWMQHNLSTVKTIASPGRQISGVPALRISESKSAWTVGNEAFAFAFDRGRGSLSSWISNGSNMLSMGSSTSNLLVPGLWRAPTDNDRSRDEPYWKRFGLHIMTTQCRSTSIARISQDEVEIRTTLFLTPPVLDWGYDAQITYKITANELVTVTVKLQPKGKVPSNVPRLGLDLRLDKRLTMAEYIGLGPGESYPDKMAAQKMGLYDSSVKDLSTDYDVPQENGNRMGARQIRLLDEAGGTGLQVTRIDGNGKFAWAAGYYSPQTLDAARHPCDLIEEEALLLRLDVATAGVGSGACGPGIGEDVQVKCEEVEFAFKLEKIVR